MKLRFGLAVCAALVALPQVAQAACQYNGVTYDVGAQMCQNGWLVECTPASYWKAIGQCRMDDGMSRPVQHLQAAELDTAGKPVKAQPAATLAPRRD